MVHVVLSSGGLNEKGHGKQFKWNPLIRSMIDDVCGDSSSTEEVSVIYCDDGSPGDWFDHNNPDCVELKCLRKLVEHFRPLAGVKMEKFSFTNPPRPAMNMIQNADIFYFKGYGGNTERILRVFKHRTWDHNRSDDIAVEDFSNRIIFGKPRPLLCFMTCGAAKLLGSCYTGDPRIKCLEVFGSARIHYFACENVSPVRVQELDLLSIPLGSGASLAIKLEPNEVEVDVINVACSKRSSKEDFCAASLVHLRKVIGNIRSQWRMHQCVMNFNLEDYFPGIKMPVMFWAYSPDGKLICFDASGCKFSTGNECASGIMEYQGGQPIQWF